MLPAQTPCNEQLPTKAAALICAIGQPGDPPLDRPCVVPMDVDTRSSGVPTPGSDADVQEAAAILLALRLGDQNLAEPSCLQLAVQQQEGGEQVLGPDLNSTEASRDGCHATPSAEDLPDSRTPQLHLAQGPDPGLPQWARRAPRTGWAHACMDPAEQGAGEQAAAVQLQDLPLSAQWYAPPPPGDEGKDEEELSGQDSGVGSEQNGSWTTRFHADSTDGSSNGDSRKPGPPSLPRVHASQVQIRQPRGHPPGRGVLASIRMKAVLIFDFLKKHKQLADEPASQTERAMLLSMGRLTPEQKERMHRLNPKCREKFIRDDPRIKGSHTTSKALRMLVEDHIVLRTYADPHKPGGGKGNPYEYLIADMTLVLSTTNYEAMKEMCGRGLAAPVAEQPAAETASAAAACY